MEALGFAQSDRVIFMGILNDMVESGQLVRTRKNKYALPETLGFLVGRLQGNSKGFAFFIPDSEDEQDIFIPPENLNGPCIGQGNGPGLQGPVQPCPPGKAKYIRCLSGPTHP